MYEKLVKRLREMPIDMRCAKVMKEAADAIEELLQKTQQLEDKLSLAIGFWDAEQAELIRKLSQFQTDISDPAWQKAHMEMGFYSPLGEVYKELGVYDEEPPKEETE